MRRVQRKHMIENSFSQVDDNPPLRCTYVTWFDVVRALGWPVLARTRHGIQSAAGYTRRHNPHGRQGDQA